MLNKVNFIEKEMRRFTFPQNTPAFTKSVYLYWGSPLAPSSVTGVYIKTRLESMSSIANRYSSSSAPAITTGLLFHFLLNQLKNVNCKVRLYHSIATIYTYIYIHYSCMNINKKHKHMHICSCVLKMQLT